MIGFTACSGSDDDEPSLEGQKFYESHHSTYSGETYYYN